MILVVRLGFRCLLLFAVVCWFRSVVGLLLSDVFSAQTIVVCSSTYPKGAATSTAESITWASCLRTLVLELIIVRRL